MRRILVVDDQSVVRELVKQVLDLWADDIEVREAEDGLQALDLLSKVTFDLIVCDINMPNLTGVGMLEQVRKMGYHGDLPIIMLTANAHEENVTEALRLGATSYVTKPFNVEDLLGALNACSEWDLSKISDVSPADRPG